MSKLSIWQGGRAFTLLLLFLVACTGSDTALSQEEWDIREAVFRYQFEHNASHAQQNVDYYFLSLGNVDPPAEFMARFGSHIPVVEPRSFANVSPDYDVTHKEDGGSGVIFRTLEIRWLDADTVEVDGGYYEARLSASSNTYKVERLEGQWVVTQNTMHEIA